jgi:ABC-type lipoprotein export system ATPase subunit
MEILEGNSTPEGHTVIIVTHDMEAAPLSA